jgi:hypothetical protein
MALDIDVSVQLSATQLSAVSVGDLERLSVAGVCGEGRATVRKNSLEAGGWELEAAYLTTL